MMRNTLVQRIGIVFKGIKQGYMGGEKKTPMWSYGLAETPTTIRHMKELTEVERAEVEKIFNQPDWDIDTVIAKSLEAVDPSVPQEKRDDCPIVFVNQTESAQISRLLAPQCRLPYGIENVRAATGNDGLRYPWGNEEIDSTRAVYAKSGSLPVKSKPLGVSSEGVHDLVGTVWEWDIEVGLRGGSYQSSVMSGYLSGGYRLGDYKPSRRAKDFGFRVAWFDAE